MVVFLRERCAGIDRLGGKLIRPMYANPDLGRQNGLAWLSHSKEECCYTSTEVTRGASAAVDFVVPEGRPCISTICDSIVLP
jgi:hypothetical protein